MRLFLRTYNTIIYSDEKYDKKKVVLVKFPLFILIVVCSIVSLSAKIVVLPFEIASIDSASKVTIRELLVEECQTQFEKDVIAYPNALSCIKKECALEAGAEVGADEVLYGVGRKLGTKWIVSMFHYSVIDGKLLGNTRLDCKSIEDFEFVIKRSIASLESGKSVAKVATVDNITESEINAAALNRKRSGFYAYGFKSGLMYPMGKKSYAVRGHRTPNRDYNDFNTSYDRDSPQSFTMQPYEQIFTTDWINWFEFSQKWALEWDLHIGWGAEVGTHFTAIRMFNSGDLSPFIGTGVGIDHVDFWDYDEDKRNTGFALNARGGLILLRTYDFRLMIDGVYKVVLNEDVDQSLGANIGVMWKKQSGSDDRSAPRTGTVTKVLATIGGIVVTWIVIALAVEGT